MNIGPKIHRDNLVISMDASSPRSTFRTLQRSNILSDPGDWQPGTGGSTGYGSNGGSGEQLRTQIPDDPWGRSSVVWRTTPDSTSGADGGWNSSYYTVDVQYTYRYSVWVRRHTTGTGGTFYMGMNPNPIRNDNGSSQGNPYFTYPSISSLTHNQWYLVVAHVFHAGYSGGRHPKSGWYENGVKISDKSYGNCGDQDTRWNETTTSAQHRTYHFYTTNTSSGIEFAYPRIDKIDGNEPTIEQLLFRGESSFRNLVGDRNYMSPNNAGAYGGLTDSNKFLKYYPMDGTDDYISINPVVQYVPSQSWTVEVVFNPWDQNDGSWSGIFGGDLGHGGYWMFHSGQLTYYEGYNGNTQIKYTGWNKTSVFTPNKMHHLTIVYKSTGSNQGDFYLYHNGDEHTQSFGWVFTHGESLHLHSLGRGSTNRPGTNDIASFRLWDTDLTSEQVMGNYNSHKNKIDMTNYPI